MADKDILEAARKRLCRAADAEQDNRARAEDDLKNLLGRQWPEDIQNQREDQGRPCLTINKLPQFVRQVTGDLRRTNPSIDVKPADGAATPEIADLFEGIIRHIQYASDASSVYEGAAESAAQCGFGYFRVLTDYADEQSFDQEIKLDRIHNPFSVYFDPDAKLPTREDAQWVFITEHMDREAFEDAYPDADWVDVEHDKFDGSERWVNGEKIVVAEYFWIKRKPARLVLLEDGSTMIDPKGPIAGIVKERRTEIPQVMWAKISGSEVLEGPQEFASRYLPVIAVTGEEIHLGEERVITSVIRFAKEPQRMYNYWASADTELVALQPRAPWLVTPDQIKGFEEYWAQANDDNRPYLPYNPDPKTGQAPSRSAPPVASQAMLQKLAQASDDMKATTGIYDASLGQRSNEQSGVAIKQRQMESDVSTSVYSDNMGKAVSHCGRILIDMIPRVYDTSRMIRIVGKDGSQGIEAINRPVIGPDGYPMLENDLSAGRYDVQVSVGPNYSTRRQEAAQSMMDFIKAFPAAATVTGDLVAKNMDWPGSDQFADRLKKVMPPGVVEPDQNDPQQMQAMQQQAAQQQAQQQAQQAAAQMALRKQNAEATEAEARAQEAQADAEKAAIEVMEKRLALQATAAQLNAAVVPARAPMMGAQPGQQPL